MSDSFLHAVAARSDAASALTAQLEDLSVESNECAPPALHRTTTDDAATTLWSLLACPATGQLLIDPIMCIATGTSYSRDAAPSDAVTVRNHTLRRITAPLHGHNTHVQDALIEFAEIAVCPITLAIMIDPVLCVGDGHSYERAAAARHFISRSSSPLTGATLDDTTLVRNHALRKAIAFLMSIPSLRNKIRTELADEWTSEREAAAKREEEARARGELLALAADAPMICNTDALSGRRIDYIGQWTGQGRCIGFAYTVRLLLLPGSAGDEVWRGSELDQPFGQGIRYGEVDAGAVADALRLPFTARPLALCNPNRIHDINYPHPDFRSGLKEGAPPFAYEDEVPVSGFMEWFISEEESDAALIENYSRSMGHVTGRAAEEIRRVRSIEFVMGAYSPSARRLLVQGTHISHGGRGTISLDKYDLALTEDGLGMEGFSGSHGREWLATLRLTASSVASKEQRERFAAAIST